VAVRFLDVEGKTREVEAEGLFATCVQHEIDHLNGVLFIDHLSKLNRDRVINRNSGRSHGVRVGPSVKHAGQAVNSPL